MRNVWKRHGTPTTPDAPREMKTTSNCANHLRHAEGEPQEFILTLNEVKGKNGVVGLRVFADAHILVSCAVSIALPAC
jgi:hypothetical protein